MRINPSIFSQASQANNESNCSNSNNSDDSNNFSISMEYIKVYILNISYTIPVLHVLSLSLVLLIPQSKIAKQ